MQAVYKKLHYIRESDNAVCFFCCSAIEKKLVSADKIRDGSFVKAGFNNCERQGKHLGSMRNPINTQAVNKLAALQRTPMNALLSQAVAEDQMTAFNMTLLYRAAPPYTQITQTAGGPHLADGASFCGGSLI